MPTDIIVREIESEADVLQIEKICQTAWKPVYDLRKKIIDAEIFESIYGDGENRKAINVADWCRQNKQNTRVATIDGVVAGFVTWEEYNSDIVELCNNAVAPEFHRRGVATALYSWFIREMKERNYKSTFVFTGLDEPHEPAFRAYQKIGFSMPIETVRLYKKL